MAAAQCQRDVVAALVAVGAKLRKDLTDMTPLHCACASSASKDAVVLATLKQLMQARNASRHVDTLSTVNGSALSCAVRVGLVESARYLLDCRANVNLPLIARSGFTALALAVKHDRLTVAKLLVAHGACTHGVMTMPTRDGQSQHASTRLSDLAQSAAMRTWLRLVQKPSVKMCDKCQLNDSELGATACLQAYEDHVQHIDVMLAKKCSNPLCASVQPTGTQQRLHLRRCGRCQQAMYCRYKSWVEPPRSHHPFFFLFGTAPNVNANTGVTDTRRSAYYARDTTVSLCIGTRTRFPDLGNETVNPVV